MQNNKTIKPDGFDLSVESRLESVANILAIGLIRQRTQKEAIPQKAREGLALSPNKCVIGNKTSHN